MVLTGPGSTVTTWTFLLANLYLKPDKKAEQPDDAIYILRDHTSSFRECFLSDFKSGSLDTYIHAIATQLLILFSVWIGNFRSGLLKARAPQWGDIFSESAYNFT